MVNEILFWMSGRLQATSTTTPDDCPHKARKSSDPCMHYQECVP